MVCPSSRGAVDRAPIRPGRDEVIAARASARFDHQHYIVRRQVLRLFGAGFKIYDSYGREAFFAEQKRFRLKEDFRIYADEARTQEVLAIRARSIIDFATAYDVVDSATGAHVGALKRQGLKSLFKDEWLVLDPLDREIGRIKEWNLKFALLRRTFPFLVAFIPQTYELTVDGRQVCELRHHLNPFVLKVTLAFGREVDRYLDRRLAFAAALLLGGIENRQGSHATDLNLGDFFPEP